MAVFRGSKVTQRGGAGAGRGDNPHTKGHVSNIQVSGNETDDAPPYGIARPQLPGKPYDWALDPEVNPEHSMNQPKGKDYSNLTDSDIPQWIADKVLKKNS